MSHQYWLEYSSQDFEWAIPKIMIEKSLSKHDPNFSQEETMFEIQKTSSNAGWITLARINIGLNHILCTKIRFSLSAWSFYKDYHPFAHLRYQYHWWELSNEVLHETFHQWAPKIPKVKLLHFWIYLIKGHFLGTFDFDLGSLHIKTMHFDT